MDRLLRPPAVRQQHQPAVPEGGDEGLARPEQRIGVLAPVRLPTGRHEGQAREASIEPYEHGTPEPAARDALAETHAYSAAMSAANCMA